MVPISNQLSLGILFTNRSRSISSPKIRESIKLQICKRLHNVFFCSNTNIISDAANNFLNVPLTSSSPVKKRNVKVSRKISAAVAVAAPSEEIQEYELQ